MATKPTLNQIDLRRRQLVKCRSLSDLGRLLKINPLELQLAAVSPLYYRFTVAKRSGGERAIEAPAEDLKKIQRRLNIFLQAVYYTVKPYCSYGYIISRAKEDKPRNICTNAQVHSGCNFLLNADFEDFFHQISRQQVYALLKTLMPHMRKKDIAQLTGLCTLEGRLPMGAPTSPALSNLCAVSFDKSMQQFAEARGLKFTRFVDDLSFSSQIAFDPLETFGAIEKVAADHNLKFNLKKTKFYGSGDAKVITGLLLDDPISIQREFYDQLDKDLRRLGHLNEVYHILGAGEKRGMIKKFKQQVWGQVNFIGMVEGKTSPLYLDYTTRFEAANQVDDTVLARRWTDFNYF